MSPAKSLSATRREYKQQYLETRIRAGVYLIRNTQTGRILIGSSKNVEAALNRHQFELRTGAHRNALLQADWAQLGQSGFEFTVLDRVKPRDTPAFDVNEELEGLLELWQQELRGVDITEYDSGLR